MLRFLHHKQLVELSSFSADLTVLDFLREHRFQCGTKEGCASGDCGACTVVIAEPALDADGKDTLTYRSVNSCITFVGALHGKQLITVENLKENDKLHPSQRAMVECHGSQCGFCTPGFVLSLFAAMKTNDTPTANRAFIDEQLGGNLCRCTGYRPIIDSAKQALDQSADTDHFDRDSAEVIKSLKAIDAIPAERQSGFLRPQSVAELCQLKRDYPQAVMLGGGTDLALSVTQHLDTLEHIITVGDLSELEVFNLTTNTLTIGAGLSLTSFRNKIIELCPELESLLVRFGGTQVRNQATVGGNFANASPVGDLPPVFIALNASIVLQSSAGQRTVAAEDFFISYKKTVLADDEFIREFTVPTSAFNSKSTRVVNRFYKISKRLDDDISAVCAAFHLEMNDDTIVRASTGFGGMAEIPKRAAALEAVLNGAVLNEKCLERAKAALKSDFQPIDDVRASADYRNLVCENLLVRLATELYAPKVATTVTAYEN